MNKKIKILQIGLGPLGVQIAKFIAERHSLTTVAAVDKNPDLVGRDLGTYIGQDPSSVTIVSSITEAIAGGKPDVAILTTVSDMQRITPQIEEIVAHGIPVISTCEELCFPHLCAPEFSARIDKAAKKNNVGVLGTGVNPGFLMDTLPTTLTAICQRVDAIKVNRYQNAKFRRLPFQKKIGAGLTLTEFAERVKNRTLRHVGLTESIQLIASRMGWDLDKTEDKIEPVIATKEIVTDAMTIAKGAATGVRQIGRGFKNGVTLIELEFQATVGEAESYDEVIITGSPDVRSRIHGGVNGDIATCAIVLNAIPQIIRSTPGLKTMVDVPPVSWFE